MPSRRSLPQPMPSVVRQVSRSHTACRLAVSCARRPLPSLAGLLLKPSGECGLGVVLGFHRWLRFGQKRATLERRANDERQDVAEFLLAVIGVACGLLASVPMLYVLRAVRAHDRRILSPLMAGLASVGLSLVFMTATVAVLSRFDRGGVVVLGAAECVSFLSVWVYVAVQTRPQDRPRA